MARNHRHFLYVSSNNLQIKFFSLSLSLYFVSTTQQPSNGKQKMVWGENREYLRVVVVVLLLLLLIIILFNKKLICSIHKEQIYIFRSRKFQNFAICSKLLVPIVSIQNIFIQRREINKIKATFYFRLFVVEAAIHDQE